MNDIKKLTTLLVTITALITAADQLLKAGRKAGIIA